MDYEEITLDMVRDFMVQREGRVTNHELVKYFKDYLTNSSNKEQARNRFKQYVNTLANISQEGGEKYLVLKRKFRVGTHLEVSEYPSHFSHQHHSPMGSCSSAGSSSFGLSSSPGIPPPYRAPPPYRPPPDPVLSPTSLRENSTSLNDLVFHSPGTRMQLPMRPLSVTSDTTLRYTDHISPGMYAEPQDLGIPPAPVMSRSSSSTSLLSSVSSTMSSSVSALVPLAKVYGPSSPEDAEVLGIAGRETPLSSATSRASLSNAASTSSVSSAEDLPPPLPLRKRQENKENRKPFAAGDARIKELSALDGSGEGLSGGSGCSSRRSSMASMDDEKKVSVREATQRFNKMASECQLGVGRLGNKASRNSRVDKDEEETPAISSFGPDGQDWLVAAAKSDFNEILRLLKIHPILAKHKQLANGYTALHWAAKNGKPEVTKLLIGTYGLDVNARSNAGYTPLHLAAIYGRHEVFSLLSHHGADLNMRDYSGKKPSHYMANSAVTCDPGSQKRHIRRKNSIKDAGSFLRIGSLNVKVRKTTEAFNNLISRDVEARLHRAWGSSDSVHDAVSIS